jgi:cytidine deaminase
VSGVNVENASYGGTICAERSALVSAVSQFGGDIELEWVIITSSNPKEAIPPCGLCLQSLIEFGKPDLPIYLGNKDELLNKYTLKDLLPHSFQSEMIK